MLLEAEFLAALQVLVYIGAVAILLMFGIMLTRNIQGDDPTSTPSASGRFRAWSPGCASSLVLAFGISDAEGHRRRGTRGRRPSERPDRSSTAKAGATAAGRTQAVNNMAKVVGDELMTRYVVAFEVAGLLLDRRPGRRDRPRPSRGGRADGLAGGRRSSARRCAAGNGPGSRGARPSAPAAAAEPH